MLSKYSITLFSEKVNREIIIISKQDIDINIFAIIFNILDQLDLNDLFDEIQILSRYIISQKKNKTSKKLTNLEK